MFLATFIINRPFLLGVPVEPHESVTNFAEREDLSQMLRRRQRPAAQASSPSSTKDDNVGETDVHVSDSSTIAHPDEHQIKLDTDRSFVLYPVGKRELLICCTTIVESSPNSRAPCEPRRTAKLIEPPHHLRISEKTSFELLPGTRVLSLQTLSASLTRSDTQGFHDIITVLFLTLPEELQLVCAEKISLHRLRDAMGKGLEPVLGLLRCVRHHAYLYVNLTITAEY
jgi:hypothetical protein